MIDFKNELVKLISTKYNLLNKEELYPLIEIPPQSDMGDYALPCFKFAKILKKAPNLIAAEMVETLSNNEYFAEIKNIGPYLNFFINKEIISKNVLTEIFEKKEKYGSSNLGQGKNVVIDFSSPNIAKPFHVGHLRSTVIGNSLYQVYQFLGFNCIGINHLGDWGTQFGKMIAAYKKWGKKEDIENDPIQSLLKLYVKFHEKAKNNPQLEEEGRSWFKKLEDGNQEAKKLWQYFIDLSLKEFNNIYSLLNVKFDYYTGESFYNDKMTAIIKLLQEKKLLEKSEGADVVDLDKYDMPPCMILKSDGATLYPTRDITAAIYRKKNYSFVKALYITDYSQKLHFAQWMKVIELMGYDWAPQLEHIPFGRVSTKEGALKTREGNVILLKDLLDKSITKVKAIIDKNNPDLENKDKVAKQVGIGAVIFNDLSNSRIKDIVFDWDRMLSFDGETGPYVQYTYARANSLLTKANYPVTTDINYSLLTDEEVINVIKLLHQFPEIIVKAMEKNEPSLISRHIINIAQAFNKFYHEYPILVKDKKVQQARLLLSFAVKTVLKTGLKLLGIAAPAKI